MFLLTPYIHQTLLVGSHFNQALNSQEHKSNHLSPLGPITSNSLLSRFTEGLNLNDLWSLTDPDGRKFTFSPPIQHSLQNQLLLCQHHTSRLSCKPPYTWNSHLWPCPNISRTATVGFTVRNLAKIWRFPSYLDRDQTLQKIIQETWTKYLTTNTMSIPVYFERLGRLFFKAKLFPTPLPTKRVTRQYIEVSNITNATNSHCLCCHPLGDCSTLENSIYTSLPS